MKTSQAATAFLITSLGLSACATTGQDVTATADAVQGEIVLSEAIAPTDATGGRAAIAIGSAIVGALVPGPWGSVAGVATGQAGNAAVTSSGSTGTTRYHVRLPDGSIEAIDQAQASPLPAGTPVDIITMSDGSKRVAAAPPKQAE